MTQSSLPEPTSPPPRRNRRWRKVLFIFSLLAVAGVGGGAWWVWVFVQEKLAPLVADGLSKELQRPVKIGRLERAGLNSIRFGATELPATVADADWAKVQAIEVNFDPWQVLWQRKLPLSVNLVKPEIFLEQDRKGLWVNLKTKPPAPKGAIEIQLTQLRFNEAKVELLPQAKPKKQRQSVRLQQIQGFINLLENNRRFSYELRGESAAEGRFRVRGESKRVTDKDLLSKLNLEGDNFLVGEVDRLIRLPIDITAGRVDSKVDVTLNPDLTYNLLGKAQLKKVSLTSPGAPKPINEATGSIELENQTVRLQNVKAKFDKIPFVVTGSIDPKKGFDLRANLPNVEIPVFFKTFQLKTPVPVTGMVNAAVRMTGPVQTPIISGTVENQGLVTLDRLAIERANGKFSLDSAAKTLEVADISVTPKVGGTVTGRGMINIALPQTIDFALQARDVPGDAIAKVYGAQTLPLKIGGVNAQVKVAGRADDPITTAVWQTPNATYAATGEVVISKSGNLIDLRRMEATIYGGKVNLTGQLIDRKNFQGNLQVGTIQLAQFNPQLTGNATGNAKVQGQITESGLAGLLGNARIEANTLGGTIVAQAQFQDQTWQADVNLGNVQLAQTNPQLRGAADGVVKLRGNVNNPTIASITADGDVRLSQGLSLVTDPIAAKFNWDGKQINLKSATARGFQADGVIFANVAGTPEITGINLNINASRLSLAALPLTLPTAVSVVGDASFNGKVTGSPTKPQVKGNLGLFDFGVNGIAFEPLQGTVDLSPNNGLKLNVLGLQDRLVLDFNAQNQPLAVDVQRGKLRIAGKAQGNLFNVALRSIPLNELSAFGIPVPNLQGMLSGDASLNLATMEMPNALFTIDQPQFGQFPVAFQGNQIQTRLSYVNGVAKGNIAINQPRLGAFASSDISTNFIYANNVFRISDFVLQKNESQIAIAGSVDLRQVFPRVEGNVRISKGRIEDVLGAAQIFELGDFARGLSLPNYQNSGDLANLTVGAVSNSNLSLKTQLERLAEVNTRIRQIRDERKSLTRRIPGEDRTEAILPQLADVRGVFDSTIRFSTGKQGINVDEFELSAKNVEWRPFPGYAEFQRLGQQVRVLQRDNQILQAQSLLISATYKDGLFDLTRATAQLGEASVNLQVNYGGENTSGQLTISKLPITDIQKFYPLSIPLAGELNATATLGGTKTQPSAGGFITIKEGGINGNPISSANSFFNYKEGRLNLDTTVKLDNPEPLKIVGEIPIPLPFLNVYPENDDLNLKINVKNEGLALMNLFNAPVAWKDGQGQVNLTIGGKLLAPTANGEIVLQNASFTTTSLPEPLTNVNGVIRFDQDRVRVESLKGEFSKGNLAVKGSLPLFMSLASLPIPIDVATQGCLSEDANNPLNIEMNRIKLSYKGLYQGAVRGCVNVAGNVFKPKISGEITLSDGQVLLSDEIAPTPVAAANAEDAPESVTGLEFDNLRLTLGNGIQIVRAPILNFVAQGTLTLNGNLNTPQPVGKIFLKAGQVNLFTTQFVLARGYTHTAIFTQSLNPLIDVRMIAAVPEVTRSPINTQQTVTSEVNDSPLFATNLGSLQTIRIQAAVQGRSDEIFTRLELTSSPSRSRNEIIGLLGGGFVNTLGRGDSTLGIANLAGSALLTNIQGFIGNALGLSEFRLFPTISTDAEKRTSTLGLAAEIGFDITPSLSASVLKILTSDQLPQFGLRYRINDNFLFRGSTDYRFEDSRAVLEYEARF
jgi:translocation and assembly module TamB